MNVKWEEIAGKFLATDTGSTARSYRASLARTPRSPGPIP